MLEYMLDTDICIYVMHRRSSLLVNRFEELSGRICISSVVLAELLFAAERSERRNANLASAHSFAGRIAILQFGASAASHYATLRAHLELAGTPCGANDILIGAHARSEGLTLVTNNRREFDRMPGSHGGKLGLAIGVSRYGQQIVKLRWSKCANARSNRGPCVSAVAEVELRRPCASQKCRRV